MRVSNYIHLAVIERVFYIQIKIVQGYAVLAFRLLLLKLRFSREGFCPFVKIANVWKLED